MRNLIGNIIIMIVVIVSAFHTAMFIELPRVGAVTVIAAMASCMTLALVARPLVINFVAAVIAVSITIAATSSTTGLTALAIWNTGVVAVIAVVTASPRMRIYLLPVVLIIEAATIYSALAVDATEWSMGLTLIGIAILTIFWYLSPESALRAKTAA